MSIICRVSEKYVFQAKLGNRPVSDEHENFVMTKYHRHLLADMALTHSGMDFCIIGGKVIYCYMLLANHHRMNDRQSPTAIRQYQLSLSTMKSTLTRRPYIFA